MMGFKFNLNKIKLNNVMLAAFSITSTIAIIIIIMTFYNRLSSQFNDEVKVEQEIITRQINAEVSTYLKTIMKVSDTLSYSVIVGNEYDKAKFSESFQLMYDSNKDKILNIALFSDKGELLVSSPAETLREDANVRNEDWYRSTFDEKESVLFSKPHVQRLFYDSDFDYSWVISVSRSVPVTINGEVVDCVLLIDINMDSLEQIFKNASVRENSYVYLSDGEDDIIYHPKMQLINSGYMRENLNIDEEQAKENGKIISKSTVGYTGWKVVGVASKNASINTVKNNLFFLGLFMFYVLAIFIVNSFISKKVSKPIVELGNLVNEIEEGNFLVQSNIKGFYEVEHLSIAIDDMAVRIQELMVAIEEEHEQKMISEFETLQSQINPHFLYNTLEVIVWMIENEQPKDASRAVVALSKFFRISLSKGKSIINVENEIEHVRNYLMIQSLRYKNRFEFNIKMSEETRNLSTIKLILQPIVENAIYHGLESLDEGEITISSYLENDFLYFSVEDNGLGMDEETLEKLRSGAVTSRKMGSGIGYKNINERIKIYFGDEYGLEVYSELDEGTKVLVKLPKVEHEADL